jgi:hypothetical protein
MDYSNSSGDVSSLEFGYFCMWNHVAFYGFLEVMVLISDAVHNFLAKLFLKCGVVSRNSNTRTPVVQHTVCTVLYFITNSVQKGSMNRKTSKRNNLCYSQNFQHCG